MDVAHSQALKSLIFPLLDDLHRVARSLSKNPHAAEDLVAETVVRACESIHRLRDKSRAKSWLLRILGNLFISEQRRHQRHRTVSLQSMEDDVTGFSLFEHLEEALHSDENPERDAIRKLMDEDIRAAISGLSSDFRLAVVLCDMEGYSYKEIAHLLSVPIGTVRSRVARGRALLQKRLWHHMKDFGRIPRSRNGSPGPCPAA
jgi:RNA polymerase sigma-70 factor (ECF subfamily)